MTVFIVRGDDKTQFLLVSAEGGMILKTGTERELASWASLRNLSIIDTMVTDGGQTPLPWMRGFVTAAVVVGVLGIATALIFHELPTAGREPLLQLIGALTLLLGSIANWFFRHGRA